MKKYPVFVVATVLVMLVACASHDIRLSNQALKYISAGNFHQAEADLNKALAINPDNPYALLNLGVVYENTDRPEQARKMYERVVELNPKEKAVMSNQAGMIGRSLGDIAGNNLELLHAWQTEKHIHPAGASAEVARSVLQPIPRANEPPARSTMPASTPPAPAAQPAQPHMPAPTAPAPAVRPEPQPSPLPAAQLARPHMPPPTLPAPPAPPRSQPPATPSGQPELSPPPVAGFAPPPTPARAGYCATEKGESLAGVAGRKQVYGDPLMWPSLLLLNPKILTLAHDTESLPSLELPAGTELLFVTGEAAAAERLKIGSRFWAVNVASNQEERLLARLVVPLIQSVYRPYITKISVKGVEYKRLRVGFFKSQTEAVAAAKSIQKKLGLPERPWIQQVSQEEFRRHAGY